MKFWPIFTILLLSQQLPLRGQEVDTGSDHERQGEVALADGLWEMAELHFRDCLATPGLPPEVKSRLNIRLAEALVREGNPAAALELLGQSFVEKNSDALFWKAHALAGNFDSAKIKCSDPVNRGGIGLVFSIQPQPTSSRKVKLWYPPEN